MSNESGNPTISYDKVSGEVIIDNVRYDSCEIVATSAEIGDSLQLFITAKNGDTYQLEAKRSFFGYGKDGRIINTFVKKLPELQKTSESVKFKLRVKQGYIPQISAPQGILLKRGEYAVISTNNVVYCQERTKTEYRSGGASFRVTKGITLHGGKTKPVKQEYFANLDVGKLVLTNKRLVFFGDRKSVTIPISKICAIERYRNAIDISKEGVMKQTRFRNIDGDLYADLIDNVYRESI